MRATALRRCAPGLRPIRGCGNVLRASWFVGRGTRAARAVAGATPLAEGSVRARGEVEIHTSPPALPGSLPQQRSLREGGSAPLRVGGPAACRPCRPSRCRASSGKPESPLGTGRIVAPAVGLSFADGLQRLFHSGHAGGTVHLAAQVQRRFEDRHIPGRNLDRLAGPGVAARAGLAVPHLEGAEAPELDAVASRQRVRQGIEEGSTISPHSLLVTRGLTASATCSTRSALVMLFSSREVWPSPAASL